MSDSERRRRQYPQVPSHFSKNIAAPLQLIIFEREVGKLALQNPGSVSPHSGGGEGGGEKGGGGLGATNGGGGLGGEAKAPCGCVKDSIVNTIL